MVGQGDDCYVVWFEVIVSCCCCVVVVVCKFYVGIGLFGCFYLDCKFFYLSVFFWIVLLVVMVCMFGYGQW